MDWKLNEPLLFDEKVIQSVSGEVLHPFPQYDVEDNTFQYDMYRCPARVLGFPRLYAKNIPSGFDKTIFLRHEDDTINDKIVMTWMRKLANDAYNRMLSSDMTNADSGIYPGDDDNAFAIVHSAQQAPVKTKHIIGREYLLEHKRIEDFERKTTNYLVPIYQSVPITSLGPICFCFEFTGMLKQFYTEAPKIIQVYPWEKDISQYFVNKYVNNVN